jgi:group I intron endonuclease
MKISGIGFIYMITSPTGRIYVGSTIDVEKRHQDYKYLDCKTQSKLYNSLKKYGYENHIIEIIWAGSIEDMFKYETLIGFGFDVLNSKNLNCKLPKLGDKYKVVSNETLEKMRVSRKLFYDNLTEERRLSWCNHLKGRKLSEEEIERRSKLRRKPIHQLDLNGFFIKEWNCAITVNKELKISTSDIYQCCKGKKQSAGKFKWKYK